MADDPLAKFTGRHSPRPPIAPRSAAPLPPELVVNRETHGREAYEAFDNKVTSPYVELRCFRSGLSTFIPYAHMGAITFNFRSGQEILFTGAGHAVTIRGRNLRDIVLALRLHTCTSIQDFSPADHIEPQPTDPRAPFVQTIEIEILHPPGSEELGPEERKDR